MAKIYVDEQVMAEINRRAEGRPPNDLIRQLLGLWIEKTQAPEPGVFLIPHSPKEFLGGYSDLSQWLIDDLANRPDGAYLVASPHYWRKPVPDSICVFHKDKIILGEGKMVTGLMPYVGHEISPKTGRIYAGVVHFDTTSIKVYKRPITFSKAEKLLGKSLTWQGMQRLTQKDLDNIRKATS